MLQRDKPIEVWGFDAPASSSALTIHYGANAVEAYWPVAADGSWRAVLPALPGAPCNSTALVLKARGVTVQSLSDVCIGDLHLFAGQSNIDIGESYANQFSPVAQVLLSMHAAPTQPQVLSVHAHTSASPTNLSMNLLQCSWVA